MTTIWMLAYFRQIYGGRVEITAEGTHVVPLTEERLEVESLHLAYSRDDLRWTALHDNRPVLTDIAGHTVIRDPFVGRGADGGFHLLATGGASPRDILYARSPDLIRWVEQRSLPVMAPVPEANNCWAPEFVWDPDRQEYFVFWSSSFREAGWLDSRIWCARTADFQEFSTPRVLFDPGYTVIDATLLSHNGTWYMAFKDERFGYEHGEHRYVKIATAPALDGPYTVATGPVTPSITEGPSLFQIRDAPPRWALTYDYCMGNDYGASVSDDLLHWERVSDALFPPSARHGSVFAVTKVELAAARDHYGG